MPPEPFCQPQSRGWGSVRRSQALLSGGDFAASLWDFRRDNTNSSKSDDHRVR